jgi:antitoxin MazE
MVLAMRSSVAKWGNSLALRLPKAYAKQLRLKPGSAVDLALERDRLVVTKAVPTLRELAARITPENRHADTDWGPARGREAW